MQLVVCAVGKMRGSAEATLVETYLKRASDAGKPLGFSGPSLQEYEPPKGLAGPKRTAKEAEWFRSAAGAAAVVALDERGDNISSQDLAAMLADWRDAGVKRVAMLIGGADGHDRAIVAQARRSIAFGKATWPHMLVRAMLAEQLYRSMTILSGHPYHRA